MMWPPLPTTTVTTPWAPPRGLPLCARCPPCTRLTRRALALTRARAAWAKTASSAERFHPLTEYVFARGVQPQQRVRTVQDLKRARTGGGKKVDMVQSPLAAGGGRGKRAFRVVGYRMMSGQWLRVEKPSGGARGGAGERGAPAPP